jgi:hypothetical protein
MRQSCSPLFDIEDIWASGTYKEGVRHTILLAEFEAFSTSTDEGKTIKHSVIDLTGHFLQDIETQ